MNKKIKTLLLVGPYPPPFGGIASHLNDLIPELIKLGYNIVTLSYNEYKEPSSKPGLTNLNIKPSSVFHRHALSILYHCLANLGLKHDLPFKSMVKIINQALLINGIVNEYNVDAVIFYDNITCLAIPFLNKMLTPRLPLGAFIFGDFYLRPEKYQKIKTYMRAVFETATTIVSSSQYCGNSVHDVLGLKFPVNIIYVGVDIHRYHPEISSIELREELNIPSESKVILFLGRMTKDMGLDFVLDVATDLLELHDDTHIIIAGACGELSPQAQQLAHSNSKVLYLENIPFDKKHLYYAASNIFIAPTMQKHACMGVSIKEAMAAGRPVVASTSGGIPEAIEDGYNGFLFSFIEGKHDKVKFLDSVNRLLTNPGLCETFGQRNRERAVELFSNSITVGKYQKLLSSLEQQA